jgi:hypothetical protein
LNHKEDLECSCDVEEAVTPASDVIYFRSLTIQYKPLDIFDILTIVLQNLIFLKFNYSAVNMYKHEKIYGEGNCLK